MVYGVDVTFVTLSTIKLLITFKVPNVLLDNFYNKNFKIYSNMLTYNGLIKNNVLPVKKHIPDNKLIIFISSSIKVEYIHNNAPVINSITAAI